MSPRTFAALLAAILLLAGPARAQLTIEIIGGGANQIPIAVLPFAGESMLPQSITEIIEQDLSRSGRIDRSEEHTSEFQSRLHLVCRLLLEKKKNTQCITYSEYSHTL